MRSREDLIDQGIAAYGSGASRSSVPLEVRAAGQEAIEAWLAGWDWAEGEEKGDQLCRDS